MRKKLWVIGLKDWFFWFNAKLGNIPLVLVLMI